MVNADKEKLTDLLAKYYTELTNNCKYDCYNCGLGILRGYGDSFSCAIDLVLEQI